MNVFVCYNFLTTKFKVLFYCNSAPFGVGGGGGRVAGGVGLVGEASVYQKRLVSVVCDGLRHS